MRCYESVGVLPEPRRTANGYRQYSDQDVERLVFIRRAPQLGLSLDDIGAALTLRDHGQSLCGSVVELVECQLEDVDHRIRELIDRRGELRALLDRAAAGHIRPRLPLALRPLDEPAAAVARQVCALIHPYAEVAQGDVCETFGLGPRSRTVRRALPQHGSTPADDAVAMPSARW